MILLRYGLPVLFVIGGIVMFAIEPDANGLHGLAMGVGAGLSVLLLNVLFRLGAHGDHEREAEAAARDYFAAHGHWPDEAPTARPQ